MTTYEFAMQLWETCIDPDGLIRNGYTENDAMDDLENFRADGWEIPEDITAEKLASEMNQIICNVKG